MKHLKVSLLSALVLLVAISCNQESGDREWREYLGGPDRNHYTELAQITPSNVNQLELVWEYHTQDSGQVQCNPIIVNGVLYGMTATAQPFALDAATGNEIWRVRDTTGATWYGTNRGVTYWEDGDDKRIFYTKESMLYAVNALTGQTVASFGDSGRVSLATGLGSIAQKRFVISNTPGAIYQNLIIMPLRLSEGNDAAPGYVQAFDTRSGALAWTFKTIPHPGEAGYETWPAQAYQDSTIGGANNWSGMAVDHERGIVFVPTGSAAFDFYGANRIGDNLYANTLLALNAETGERLWHFQMVHHDILDRDAPAPPNLVTVTHEGKAIDAVAQVTKQGFVFVFNRETGEPLFPVEEIPAPATDIPGEVAAPTQPKPTKPLPYARQYVREGDISPFAENRQELLNTLRNSRSQGPFTPLSRQGTIVFPGLDGGAEWGGAAVDPEGVMYVNSNEMAWLILLDTLDFSRDRASLHPGEQLYLTNCVTCHSKDRKGNPASGYPSLVQLNSRLTNVQVDALITGGKGMMPAFKNLTKAERDNLVAFLMGAPPVTIPAKQEIVGRSEHKKKQFKISGYTKFLDRNGYPAIAPPWGTLNAIDLNTGEYRWKITYGNYPELANDTLPETGSESYGGPVITASGLLFIAGTKDRKFRAYEKSSGKLLWETTLPAAGFATPSSYSVNGRQYIVIACGGTKLGAPKGESYVAYALPGVP
jgi:quinoprotein glucose dehydrogenase